VAGTPRDWVHVLAIRLAVFVVEQHVPFDEEVDAHDPEALHLLAWSGAVPVGTARLVVAADHAVIGRVAVLRAERGRGVGDALMRSLLDHARARDVQTIELAAQLPVRAFYQRFGFVAAGPHFLDAGIWHQRMRRAL
jgi:predicted GNAT family N-acyltransferase